MLHRSDTHRSDEHPASALRLSFMNHALCTGLLKGLRPFLGGEGLHVYARSVSHPAISNDALPRPAPPLAASTFLAMPMPGLAIRRLKTTTMSMSPRAAVRAGAEVGVRDAGGDGAVAAMITGMTEGAAAAAAAGAAAAAAARRWGGCRTMQPVSTTTRMMSTLTSGWLAPGRLRGREGGREGTEGMGGGAEGGGGRTERRRRRSGSEGAQREAQGASGDVGDEGVDAGPERGAAGGGRNLSPSGSVPGGEDGMGHAGEEHAVAFDGGFKVPGKIYR